MRNDFDSAIKEKRKDEKKGKRRFKGRTTLLLKSYILYMQHIGKGVINKLMYKWLNEDSLFMTVSN